jgi:hypothetical protein
VPPELRVAAEDAAHALTPIHAGAGGRDLSSAVYGSLLVTTLVAVQARSDASVEFISATLLIGVGVFWLTEVWSELVNHRVRGPITRGVALSIMRDESPMLSAAVIPALLLGTSRLGWTTTAQAIDLAMLAAVAQLFVWGLAVGLAMRRGWGAALIVATVDCLFGLVIVGLKAFVLH